eukprot:CAMPEP_0201520704 /NCGR_PEP_ID=MMETSP0161_2-20130828/12202_1 /ASSEMBLY_ACC=CAM_ASM_000251 /TAXON_ID=180227 /ORGANISM="Neoparamoeba aestuarina, Strain SoJaBio B1-5/56/2" /LENGTH=262 /DNA_ID=CAMNT_0047919173 /DNA_START=390 /DNA_END=1178 /DNA_ORIENTATION=+
MKKVRKDEVKTKNLYLEASDKVNEAQRELKTLIANTTNVVAFQTLLFTHAFGVAQRVDSGFPTEKVLAQLGLGDFADGSVVEKYVKSCVRLRQAVALADQRSYEMVAEDRGWPRRAHHTGHRISFLLGDTTKKYKPEKWFAEQGVTSVLVKEDPMEPWNSIYHPDVSTTGITIAVSLTSDLVHIKEYSPEMTFFDLALQLINKYPTHQGRAICVENSLFVPYGRVIVCKRRESLQTHHVIDGTLIDFVSGVHADNCGCLEKK